MKIHHKVRSVYWVAASIIIIGAIASMGAFWAAKDSVNDTSLDLLKGDAGQGSLVMSELVNSEFVSPMMQLGKLVTPIGVAPATFEAGASGLSKATGASIALLRGSVATCRPWHRWAWCVTPSAHPPTMTPSSPCH